MASALLAASVNVGELLAANSGTVLPVTAAALAGHHHHYHYHHHHHHQPHLRRHRPQVLQARTFSAPRSFSPSKKVFPREASLKAPTTNLAVCPSSASSHRNSADLAFVRKAATVALSQQRLQEFIRAELVYFGQQIPEPLSLEQIVRASSPVKVARLLHRELPRRFAARVSHIESLEGWPDVEELCRLREIFMESFRQLRLANPPLKGTTSVQELENYSQVINQLRQRHKPVTALLGEALRKMRRNFEGPEKEQFINTWTDDFFCSRISTEMLTKHFVAIMNEPPNKASTRVGVVDTQCNPGRICQEAADQVLYSLGSSVHDMPELDIEVNATNCTHSGTDIEIPYIPMYLYYIVQELLRNSARATLEAGRKDGAQQTRPISVTVCSDQKQVAIRIADKGGGIPLGSGEKIWSYQFSTSIQPFEAYLDGASPLSGRGMGLPLGRLYASYLGGSLELMNMPGIGVDAYLFLNRIPNFDMAAFDTSRLGP